MPMKRKAVSVLKRPARAAEMKEGIIEDHAPEVDEVAEEDCGEDQTAVSLKRKPAANSIFKRRIKAARAEETVEDEEPCTDAAEETSAEADESSTGQQEEEVVAARKKELKSLPIDELKQLAASKGIEKGKKEDLVVGVAAHEARERAQVREQEAKTRMVVVKKKEELEALPLPELKELCVAKSIKGVLSKQTRVEELVKAWQEDDGVDKALARLAREEREAELASMDKMNLRKFCDKIGTDPLVKEVIISRIVKKEGEKGRFARPRFEEWEEEQSSSEPADVVARLLAKQASSKKELELKKKQEETAASKKEELGSKSADDLKRLMKSKGVIASNKKDDMVKALYEAFIQEEKESSKKDKLKNFSIDHLRKLASSKGLTTGKKEAKKEAVVDALLDYETKVRKEIVDYEAKVQDVLEKKRQEFEALSAAEFKERCEQRGLKIKAGTTKEERLQNLLHDLKDEEVEKIVSANSVNNRREALGSMDMAALEKLCAQAEIDPLVKEVMVERVLDHEAEFGRAPEAVGEPPAKKARAQGK